jgi:hypothetical protein
LGCCELKGEYKKKLSKLNFVFAISKLIQHQNLNIPVPTPHNTLVIMWGKDNNFHLHFIPLPIDLVLYRFGGKFVYIFTNIAKDIQFKYDESIILPSSVPAPALAGLRWCFYQFSTSQPPGIVSIMTLNRNQII